MNLRPNILFSGIPTSNRNLCWDRHFTFCWCPASISCATYFDAEGSQVAKDASASRDKLIDIFNRIERFFHRLEVYTSITPTMAMTNVIVDIMVEILTIVGIVTKEVKRGRFSELKSCIFTLPD
jgi:hypothetical protein